MCSIFVNHYQAFLSTNSASIEAYHSCKFRDGNSASKMEEVVARLLEESTGYWVGFMWDIGDDDDDDDDDDDELFGD
ncbi:uncharacterized protein EAF01_003752 [Botrytis porri]|uniref:Uncharacterized protein n=1 Tax=Botrytis porri TaxID=87229 RepID=A0A4Z1KNR3_9HELO|nr:uncharacterized protein EAF01_003752 [Botrytis porri]KAF7910034.1 hypothetical protein EAF01_003752 [Botrytis porri]TGO87088.1 hypothetical protein BPOR_0251g00090 [Botrytis porri]